jgi:hypothetical protein
VDDGTTAAALLNARDFRLELVERDISLGLPCRSLIIDRQCEGLIAHSAIGSAWTASSAPMIQLAPDSPLRPACLDAASRVRSGSRHTEAGLVARLRLWRFAARRPKIENWSRKE